MDFLGGKQNPFTELSVRRSRRVNQYFLVEIKNELDRKTGKEKTIRKYSTPGFLECINRLAQGFQIHDEDPNSSYLVLSPGDLVYVPSEEETLSKSTGTIKKVLRKEPI